MTRRPQDRDWASQGTPQRWDGRLSPAELRQRIDGIKAQLPPGTRGVTSVPAPAEPQPELGQVDADPGREF